MIKVQLRLALLGTFVFIGKPHFYKCQLAFYCNCTPLINSLCLVICLWMQGIFFGRFQHLLRRRQWQPTPVLLPGKSHSWRSLVGCSPWGHKESDKTKRLPFHFSLSCIGEGNGSPLQCSCLENPRDRRAWWAAVHGVAQSRTRLKRLSSSSIGFFFFSSTIIFFLEFCFVFTFSCLSHLECILVRGMSYEALSCFPRPRLLILASLLFCDLPIACPVHLSYTIPVHLR